MKWFCKILLASVATLAITCPVAYSGTGSPRPVHNHVRAYYVYYRYDPGSPWICYGGYNDHGAAVRCAHQLRRAYHVQTFIRR